MVAFSGGVDSSYLAWAADRALGSDALAVTALSPSYPESHRRVAEDLVERFELAHRFVDTHEMERDEYRANASDRCYHCKSELFDTMDRLCGQLGFDRVSYGVNTDDTADFRPGHRAANEHGVMAPFLEVGLSKAEIRDLSRAAGLPTADLPASACLSSRLPYGTEVTTERLRQVERGEQALRDLGFKQLRLRHHGELARVEIDPAELPRALESEMARRIVEAIKPLGFRYVSLDLEGYRTGSLNEVLQIQAEPIR
ncbi:MAG: TIGR00268 family protein [Deltaproteobacteria bacterium]|nr:TIGR00268 family protein [Deltaproteobacteria bacterium]